MRPAALGLKNWLRVGSKNAGLKVVAILSVVDLPKPWVSHRRSPLPSATIRDVRRVEAIWTRILGTALILLGLTLLASPQIAYRTSEEIPHTRYSVKSEKTLIVPGAAAVLIIAAGVTVFIIATRKPTA